MTDDEDSADAAERAEAEALARAIEGASSEAPRDVLETTALLRAVGAKSELPSERARAVYAGLEPAVEHYVRPHRSGVVITLIGLGAGLAAAAALVLFLTRPEPGPVAVNQGRTDAPALPAPSRELLAAQAALGAAGASEAAYATFERDMRAYRTSVLTQLIRLYPPLRFIERAHARADAAAADAPESLRAALAQPVPTEVRPEHRRVALQDLWFRLAHAELARGRSAEALAAADRGLALGPARDLFTANLLVARGEALEKLGRRAEAATAYFEALEINQKLLHDALPPPDQGPP